MTLLIKIHNISRGNNLYEDIMNLLNNYNFKKEFEKVYESRERRIIVCKHNVELIHCNHLSQIM